MEGMERVGRREEEKRQFTLVAGEPVSVPRDPSPREVQLSCAKGVECGRLGEEKRAVWSGKMLPDAAPRGVDLPTAYGVGNCGK